MSKAKIPPHDLEAEKALLGSVLIDNTLLPTLLSSLTKEDFYEEEHQIIFERIDKMFSKNINLDLLTLKSELDRNNELQKIGGITYLSELTEGTYSLHSFDSLIKIIKDKSLARQMLLVSRQIENQVFQTEEGEQVFQKAQNLLLNVWQKEKVLSKDTHVSDILGERYNYLAEVKENPEIFFKNRIFTKFSNLDLKLSWIAKTDLVILAARPSMGKTAFSLAVTKNIARENKNVYFFSLEMSKEQLIDRLVANEANVDIGKMVKWELTDNEFFKIWEAMDKLAKLWLFIEDNSWGNFSMIRSKILMKKKELEMKWETLDFVIIDYLQLMSYGKFTNNRVQEISAISRELKSLAKEIEAPIMVLSQLSRNLESRADKRPIMSDLRESGSIEQDADSILMLYREEYYDEFTDRKWITEVLIRKNRNWTVGLVELMFNKNTQSFSSIESKYWEMYWEN